MQENVNIPDSTITTNLSFRQLVLMNMQQLTNFPYIEKDFDALTDYELLSLVVKFLNDVIANQNEQNASITRMYQSFLALQTYVNNTKDTLEAAFNSLDDYVRNYFDNLDVQDEINNKLDQMLEDGVLEQIIEQFLQSTALWCYDSVADMQLATNLTNGSYVKTFGFYQVNDGGGSTYKIRTKETGEIPDGLKTFSLYNTTLIAELSCDSNIINIKQFGAYCDDTHDDSDALEACLNYVGTLSLRGGTWRRTILIPAVVKVTRRIDCTTDQFKMLGTSLNNSRIVFYGATSYMNFGDTSRNYHEIEVENVKFYGDYSQTQSIVKFTNCYNIYLTRVETCNGGENQYNISFINCGLMFLDRCTIVGSNDIVNYPGNRNGIYVNTDGSIFNFTNANCWNLNNVFKFGSMQNINIQNNWIECYKSLIEFDCVENMTHINLKLENNSLNTHKQSDAFYPTNLNFIKLNMADNTNLFGSNFSINNNTIYFWDVGSVNGDSLIYLTGIGASNTATWDINFNHNIFSGKRLSQLGVYVFKNTNQTFYNRYNVKFKSLSTVVGGDSQYITDNKAIISCILNEGQKGQVTAPNGIYVGNSGNENYGNIYYENGNFYGGYAGTLKQIPKRVGTAFPLVTQSTDMVQYVNDLTAALIQSGIIDRQS